MNLSAREQHKKNCSLEETHTKGTETVAKNNLLFVLYVQSRAVIYHIAEALKKTKKKECVCTTKKFIRWQSFTLQTNDR